jgi:rhamnogalacturonan endolyase
LVVLTGGESTQKSLTFVSGEVQPGELRFLARLKKSALPTGVKHPVADNAGGTAIEGKDVFRVGGQTRCKFFSSTRFIDDTVHSIHGRNVTVSMIIPTEGYETASGGPFMRDINNQGTSNQQEFYFYMNSGHLRTEPWRMGLKGPYALSFSTHEERGIDTGFFGQLNIPGFVPASGRGRVSGTASGVPPKFRTVLHWHNAQNQYWVYAETGGHFKSPLMKPGTYTMTLYKQELKVAQSSVQVTAGGSSTANIASAEKVHKPIWRVGEFDGQPFEFKNGENFLTM